MCSSYTFCCDLASAFASSILLVEDITDYQIEPVKELQKIWDIFIIKEGTMFGENDTTV